jgi:hypothetical protein
MHYVILVFLSLTFACKNSKPVAQNSNQNTNMTEPATNPRVDLPDSMYRVIVSFISIGSGTDAAAIEKLEVLINQHQQNFGMPVAREEIAWGREGEVDYCFKLLGQDKKAKDNFVRELREAFKDNKLVQITENAPAPHKARPAFNK